MSLRLASDLSLPKEAVTQTFAVLAKRGAGKTYLTLVMVEEMLKAGLQVVVADPVGVTWGLRASADGKREGLPIVVLGGEHGDLPLAVETGALVASAIVEEQFSAVLDLSLLRKGEQVRFMTDFAETLYHKNRAPLHLVLDEADAFAPQKPMKGQERMLGAVEDLVRRGRARGIGITLTTQRAAVLNKDVLTQVEVLIALRTIAPQDRDAIDAWIKVHGTPQQREQLMGSLPSLPIGTAWFWSPGWLDMFKRVEVRKRETFDSSATPTFGQKTVGPKRLAVVDLENLKVKMAATIEKAKADDPRALRQEIAKLKAELQKAHNVATPKTDVQIKEVPVLKGKQLAQLETFCTKLMREAERHGSAMSIFWSNLNQVADSLLKAIKSTVPEPHAMPPRHDVSRRITTFDVPKFPSMRKHAHESKTPMNRDPDSSLGKSERAILTAIAQCQPAPCSRIQASILSGYSIKSSSFSNALGALRSAGLINGQGNAMHTTETGLNVLGPFDTPPTGPALAQWWAHKLGQCERLMLEALCEAETSMSKETLSARTGYSLTSSSFSNALGKLRSLGLIDGRGELRACPMFFEP